MKAACETCGYIHTSTDARAVDRFSAAVPMFVAANAGTPPRATRAEAEADECAWRQRRNQTSGADAGNAQAPGDVDAQTTGQPSAMRADSAPEPEPPAPFPAATMETAARAKAWHDFLAQVRLSLMVWQIDGDVRDGCEHVLAWLRRCHDELTFGGGYTDVIVHEPMGEAP